MAWSIFQLGAQPAPEKIAETIQLSMTWRRQKQKSAPNLRPKMAPEPDYKKLSA